MARVQLLSDLHFECHADGGESFVNSLDPTGVDVLVIAGDLAEAASGGLAKGLELLCARFPEVVYVIGNHEFYYSSPEAVEARRQEFNALFPNLHWLDCEMVDVAGLRFGGTPLWFRLPPYSGYIRDCVRDFSIIKGYVPWAYEANDRARDFIAANAAQIDVMVTHFLPTEHSVAPQFKKSALNPYFVSDVERDLRTSGIPLWVHGHTHTSCDYTLGRTRVVCNPFGYVGAALNPTFNDRLVIAVESRAPRS